MGSGQGTQMKFVKQLLWFGCFGCWYWAVAIKVVSLGSGIKGCCCSSSRWCDWCSGRGGGIAVKDTVMEW